MELYDELYQSAALTAEKRYPEGWAGAAAIRTDSGNILTSIAPETKNDALSLCMEVGACLEAHKLNESVTHSICLYRKNQFDKFIILSPCGICLERLSHWGGDVQVAISNPDNTLIFKQLRELLPHHWSQVNGKSL